MKRLLGVELADVFVLQADIRLEWSRFVASVSYFGGPLQQLNVASEFGGTVGGEKVEGVPMRKKGSTLLRIITVGVLSFVRLIDCFFVHSSSTSTRNIFPFTLVVRSYFFGDSAISFLCAEQSRCFDSRLDWKTTSLVELNWQSKRIELNA
jgi:hypothetical protein